MLRRYCPPLPVDIVQTLGPLRRGGSDPTMTLSGREAWRATRTPAGPATVRIAVSGAALEIEAWGPGAETALEGAPTLLGDGDSVDDFRPVGLIRELHRRMPGLRITRSQAVFEASVPTILEQKVPGIQARRSYTSLVRALAEPAPGPAKLLLPPAPARLASMPYWAFHPHGVERRRAETIRTAARSAPRLEEAASLPPARARARIASLPGLGPWSAAEIAVVALGDADAVSVGDYHLQHVVTWALRGRPRGSDAEMLEILEPFRPHRGRVLRLLVAAGLGAPRFGPRMPLRSIARQ
jgi:3-methyladenine DNA glycosylase/8-oxoguanine DNA glycosylase